MTIQDQIQAPVPVAVIGMACLFPKAPGLKEYWRLISRGQDAIDEIPDTHWSPGDYFDADPKRPDHVYCTRGGFLRPVDFDPTEFGIPPSILEATDTSQLLSLVTAKAALEDAGYGETGREFDRSRACVVLGITGTQELVIPLSARLYHPHWRRGILNAGIDPDTADDIIRRISEEFVPWQESSFPGLLGNVVSGRITNRLDLGGTNCAVDAACASSMSAIHMALMELQTGKSDMAVTGGADCLNDIFMHMCFSKTPILSPTGDVRPFSAEADGTLLGEGIGVLILKRLVDAESDGDRVYAVIRGMGTGSDGKSSSIYAPLADGQLNALRRAYEEAGFSPHTLGMIEAHGTGTRVGDAVEIAALDRLMAEGEKTDGAAAGGQASVAVGTVKSMIGHTKAAAGAAGLIKAVLSLHHKTLPPTLKIGSVDPELQLNKSSLYLNTETRPWIMGNTPRRAGVSSFGFGGANYHIVLEEYRPEKTDVSWDGSVEIFAFSADSRGALAEKLERFKSDLPENPDIPNARVMTNIANLAAAGRASFSTDDPHRCLLVVEKETDHFTRLEKRLEDAIAACRAPASSAGAASPDRFMGGPDAPGGLALVFAGQGSQYAGMGRDLVSRFPEALDIMETADRLAGAFTGSSDSSTAADTPYETAASPDAPDTEAPAAGKRRGRRSLSRMIFPEPGTAAHASGDDHLRATDIAQPAIGAISAAMLKILERFGIRADVVCGHSFGELTALYAAGWMDLETFLELALLRGQVMSEAGKRPADNARAAFSGTKAGSGTHSGTAAGPGKDPGTMTAVKAPLEIIDRLISDENLDLVLANRNSPEQGVISGPTPEIQRAEALLAQRKIPFRRLPVSAAFHSRLMEEAARPFAEAVRRVRMKFTDMPVFSNITGQAYPRNIEDARELLAAQILSSVDFISEIKNLFHTGVRTFVEVGPKPILSGLIRAILVGLNVTAISLDDSAGRRFGMADLARLLCTLAALGHPVNFEEWEQAPSEQRKQRMSIPLSGANYISPRKKSAPAPARSFSLSGDACAPATPPGEVFAPRPEQPEPQPVRPLRKAPPSDEHRRRRDAALSPSAPDKPNQTGNQSMTRQEEHALPSRRPEPDHGSGGVASDVFNAVREGMRAMQSLQAQTTDAHKLFLESQTQALLTVQRMMESARHLFDGDAASVSGAVRESLPPDAPPVKAAPASRASVIPSGPEPLPQETPVLPPVSAVPAPAPATDPVSVPAALSGNASVSRADLESALLDVVSELTGYPVDMLNADMDIEADLGIDSIKRVEILSGFEEKMPEIPPVSPEIMGTLNTLGQIIDYMTGGNRQADGAAAPASASPVPAAPSGLSADAAAGEIESAIMAVVSDLTGYPAEMLSLDMDIESDLGIDSIKRVEILSEFEIRMPELPSVSPEIMGTLRTLGQIVDYLRESSGMDAASAGEMPPEQAAAAFGPVAATAVSAPPASISHSRPDPQSGSAIDPIDLPAMLDRAGEGVKKKIIQLAPWPDNAGPGVTNKGKAPILVADLSAAPAYGGDESLASGLIRELDRRGHAGVMLSAGAALNMDGPLGGLVLLADNEGNSGITGNKEKSAISGDDIVKTAFALLHRHAAALETEGRLLAAVFRMDGGFGFTGAEISAPWRGGLSGLIKTAAIEWPGVCAHAVDLSPEISDPLEAARRTVDVLLSAGPVEAGIGPEHTVYPRAMEADYPAGLPDLEPGDLILVTGGARGVTAEAALALARVRRPSFLLVGRSPLPGPEPAWLSGLSAIGDIKNAILQNEFSGKAMPADVESAYRRYMAAREVRDNLAALNAAGSRVRYASLDVRDPEALARAVEEARADMGPVTAVIHGAGVLRDRFIADKSPEDFARVYDTKVGGMRTVMSVLADVPLKYIVLFSSVAARTGNKGQADYAAANEVLNKTARQLSVSRPGCRVISFNWGPWDGGMVTPALKKEFTRHGIPLVPLKEGAMAMVAEMAGPPGGPVEVLVGGGLPAVPVPDKEPGVPLSAPETVPAALSSDLFISFTQDVDVERFPILKAHVLGGKPVVPFALMAEWMGHGALHENPGLYLRGLDDMRLLKGIRLDNGAARPIRLLTGRARRKGDFYEVPVEIRNGAPDSGKVLHTRAVALLSDTPESAPPGFSIPADIRMKSYARTVDEVYGTVLFHGSSLQGISEIMSCTAAGMAAKIQTAPAPGLWMKTPLRSSWISDPLVLDSAFQMAIVWCHEQKGMVSLPSYAASYRQFQPEFPAGEITAVLETRQATDKKLTADITFLDRRDKVVARLTGYEAVMDHGLTASFKQRSLSFS